MKSFEYIKEKELAGQSKAISTKELSILFTLIKDHICKINCKDGRHGTGFFCNIPFGWNNTLKVLMTNNHVLNLNDILPDQTINFTLNNDDEEYNIPIGNDRKTYTDESSDVTIIEIKENDKIKKNSFFNLDEQIFKENSIKIFKNCQIFLLHYPKGVEMEI